MNSCFGRDWVWCSQVDSDCHLNQNLDELIFKIVINFDPYWFVFLPPTHLLETFINNFSLNTASSNGLDDQRRLACCDLWSVCYLISTLDVWFSSTETSASRLQKVRRSARNNWLTEIASEEKVYGTLHWRGLKPEFWCKTVILATFSAPSVYRLHSAIYYQVSCLRGKHSLQNHMLDCFRYIVN